MLNEDGTPRRNEIVFVSPTGEEIKSKRQLQQYLKSHSGGPPSSEFDWGTGILPTVRLFAKQVEICCCDTPRRSARIRERAKAVETPEDEKPKKRERKSSSQKAAKQKKDDDDVVDGTPGTKEDVTVEETKASADVQMKEADDANKVKDGNTATEAANEDAAGEQDSIVKANGSVEEKTEASSENDGTETATAADAVTSDEPADTKVLPSSGDPEEASTGKEGHEREVVQGNSVNDENPDDAVVTKEVPSANCSDGKHLPTASPLLIDNYVNINADGGGHCSIYGEDGGHLAFDPLGESQPRLKARVVGALITPPTTASVLTPLFVERPFRHSTFVLAST
ncbi:hypothetical protein BHM03_00016641 [Ensete ventricosum]|nr:hypothetical protein BHM03_00016641 [Ensete ventricosum]